MPMVTLDIDAEIERARRYGSPATKAAYAAADAIDTQPDGAVLLCCAFKAAPAAPAELRGLLYRDCPAAFSGGTIRRKGAS